MNPSVKRFKYFLNEIPLLIKQNLKTMPHRNYYNLKKLFTKKHIFQIFGDGSSGFAAELIHNKLISNGFSSYYLNDPLLANFKKKQINFIVVSYSWNTKNINYITSIALKNDIPLIIFTNNVTKQKQFPTKKIFTFKILPDKEKLFCRPASQITSAIVSNFVLDLIIKNKNKLEFYNKLSTSIKNEIKKRLDYKFANNILTHDHIVFLSPQKTIVTAKYASLALNEGAGKLSNYYINRAFIHGYWVPYLNSNIKTFFIIIKKKNKDEVSEHIKLFLNNTNSKYNTISINTNNETDFFVDSLLTLIKTFKIIIFLNKKTQYDMNKPKGKEAIKLIY